MVEKELQCMAALQNHLCECSSDIAIIIGIIYLMFSPYEWFLYMIYVKIIMMFEFEFSIKLKIIITISYQILTSKSIAG